MPEDLLGRPSGIEAVLREINGVPQSRDRGLVRQKSRDFYWYSPVLKRQLDGKTADAVVRPRNEVDVLAVLAACRRHGVPVTARGAGTGNYGQCVPLEGGVVLDLGGLDRLIGIVDGVAEVEAGAKLIDIDLWARTQGWELRLWPSTKRTATAGGFVAGGGAGVGGLTHGTLKERGNLVGLTVATMESEPRLLELSGTEANPLQRTYGTAGIITRVRLPLTPAQAWRDVAVAFDRFEDAAACTLELGGSDGIAKKMAAAFDPRLPPFFGGIASAVPAGNALMLTAVAPGSLTGMRELIGLHGGRIVAEQDAVSAETDPDATPFYEYCWNHTTLQVLKRDRGVTYLQCRFPFEGTLDSVFAMQRAFPDEVWMHVEAVRFGGRLTMSALPVLRFSTEERLAAIMTGVAELGISIANPHVFTIEDGSSYRAVDADVIGWKRQFDPLGLLNPGKLRSFVPSPPCPELPGKDAA